MLSGGIIVLRVDVLVSDAKADIVAPGLQRPLG